MTSNGLMMRASVVWSIYIPLQNRVPLSNSPCHRAAFMRIARIYQCHAWTPPLCCHIRTYCDLQNNWISQIFSVRFQYVHHFSTYVSSMFTTLKTFTAVSRFPLILQVAVVHKQIQMQCMEAFVVLSRMRIVQLTSTPNTHKHRHGASDLMHAYTHHSPRSGKCHQACQHSRNHSDVVIPLDRWSLSHSSYRCVRIMCVCIFVCMFVRG